MVIAKKNEEERAAESRAELTKLRRDLAARLEEGRTSLSRVNTELLLLTGVDYAHFAKPVTTEQKGYILMGSLRSELFKC